MSEVVSTSRASRSTPGPMSGTGLGGVVRWVRRQAGRHHRVLWWLHSAYALGVGACVVVFADKGFAQARYLVVTLCVLYLALLVFFRMYGPRFGASRTTPGATTIANSVTVDTVSTNAVPAADIGARPSIGFFVVTYVLKNLYQGMLFFLLPFYFKSATLGTANTVFLVVLAVCAVASTIDLFFDRLLMRFRALASLYYALTLFACLNLAIPALFPDTRTLYSLLAAAGLSAVAFVSLHATLQTLLSRRTLALVALLATASMTTAYMARRFVPPVPMHLAHGGVGPAVLVDGRLALEASSLHVSALEELFAVTDIVVPGGRGDRLHHIWRHEGEEVLRFDETTSRVAGPEGAVRLRSTLGARQPAAAGAWTVDVETEDGQLVGRATFTVTQ